MIISLHLTTAYCCNQLEKPQSGGLTAIQLGGGKPVGSLHCLLQAVSVGATALSRCVLPSSLTTKEGREGFHPLICLQALSN